MDNLKAATQPIQIMTITPPEKPGVPANYVARLSVAYGIIFGQVGAIFIMGVIALLTLTGGEDLERSPRIIASVFLGKNAATGLLPVVLGTVIHLMSGAMYGAIFAVVMSRLSVPRPIWILVGLLYGVVIWIIAAVGLPVLVQTLDVNPITYFSVLLISHVLFGLTLGFAGAFHGLSESDMRSY